MVPTVLPRSTAPRSRLALSLFSAAVVIHDMRSRIWIMPRGSSSVWRYTGSRECSASRNTPISSATVVDSSTAMMSARGTMTSSTVSLPKRSILSSMARSCPLKVLSPAPLLRVSASSITSRRSGSSPRPKRASRRSSQDGSSSAIGSSIGGISPSESGALLMARPPRDLQMRPLRRDRRCQVADSTLVSSASIASASCSRS